MPEPLAPAPKPDNVLTLTAQDNTPAVLAERAQAAQEAVERYRQAVRAPWVPLAVAPESNAMTAAVVEPVFDRNPGCLVCSVRYSRCYCPEAVTT